MPQHIYIVAKETNISFTSGQNPRDEQSCAPLTNIIMRHMFRNMTNILDNKGLFYNKYK